jgi:hypothetical protein
MRKIFLKIFVVILLLLQAGIGFICIYALNHIYPKVMNAEGIIFNKEILFASIITSFIISFLFVIIIFSQVGKKVTIIREVQNIQDGKITKEPKQKKVTEQEQKNIQLQNEKKKQILSELLKNLNAQLSLENYTNQALINISRQYDIFQAIFFVRDQKDGVFRKSGAYAYYTQDDLPEFADGVGLTGQVASNKKLLNISNMPDKYITVLSGLGKSSPSNLLIVPVLFSDKTIGIIELASFIKFDSLGEQILTEVSQLFGQHISEIVKKPETSGN